MSRVLATLTRADLPEGKPQVVLYPPLHILVVRVGDDVFALESVCCHAGASLLHGKILAGEIECRAHGFRFELCTGRRVAGDGEPCHQKIYRVERTGETWLVLDESTIWNDDLDVGLRPWRER